METIDLKMTLSSLDWFLTNLGLTWFVSTNWYLLIYLGGAIFLHAPLEFFGYTYHVFVFQCTIRPAYLRPHSYDISIHQPVVYMHMCASVTAAVKASWHLGLRYITKMVQGFPISFCSSQHFVHHSQSKQAACLAWTNKEKLQEHSWLTFVCLFVCCCQFGWGCCFQKCLLRYSWWKLLSRPAETGVRLYTTLPHKHQIIHWAVCMYTFLTLLLLFASTELAWTVHAVTATGVYQNVGKFCFALMYQVPLAALYFISYNTERIQLKSKYGDTAANTHCYSRLFLS